MFIRKLNRRDSTLWRSLVSLEFTSDEISFTEGHQRFIRKLNRRDSTLWRSLVSLEFTSDEISFTEGHQRFIP